MKTKLFRYLRIVYSMLAKLRNGFYFLSECFGPYQKTKKYKEFVRAYTRKYSLISRITGNNIYEPELSSTIKFNKEGFRDVDRQVIKNNDVLRIGV